MIHNSYPSDPVGRCLAGLNSDLDLDNSVSETHALLDSMPVFDPKDPEALEIETVFRTESDPLVETITPPPVTLNPLPPELKYAQLDSDGSHPVIISSSLTTKQEGNLLERLRNKAYDLSKSYKASMKKLHDRKILRRDFQIGDKVLLYNSRLHLFPGKLQSRWSGPFEVSAVTPFGAITCINPADGTEFQVNGQRLKHFHELRSPEIESILLEDPTYIG
jgi:hypothetical protein